MDYNLQGYRKENSTRKTAHDTEIVLPHTAKDLLEY
jgi:hypothetical protein